MCVKWALSSQLFMSDNGDHIELHHVFSQSSTIEQYAAIFIYKSVLQFSHLANSDNQADFNAMTGSNHEWAGPRERAGPDGSAGQNPITHLLTILFTLCRLTV